VGLDRETGLPDIAWGGEVPAGTYKIGGQYGFEVHDVPIEQPYRLSRYPITNAQFQCFLDAPDWDNPAWWKDIPPDEVKFAEPAFPYANHPRERVSWYQALAFCRWLNDKLRRGLLQHEELAAGAYELQLPHEYEWEVAARWPNEDVHERLYPWGDEFEIERANTREGAIGQTTAVGLYPSGKNRALELYDLSGNVWEWCRNNYIDPEDDQIDDSGDSRVVRGGSWINNQNYARAAYRNNYNPDNRNDNLGFRVVARRPPSH
jgi:formylglycine-generating enzyme required for sulfatase activity